MPNSAIIALLIAGSSPQAEAGITTVQIAPDGLVRVGDLARVARGAELAILKVSRSMDLSTAQQAQLVRNRLPGAAFTLRYNQPVHLARHDRPALSEAAECLAATNLIPAGRILEQTDVVAVSCDAKAAAGILRPVAGGYQARIDIPQGTPLGRPHIQAQPPVAAATQVVVRTTVGPVIIERSAETIQTGRAGRPVFARTEDGAVLVAPLAAGQGIQD